MDDISLSTDDESEHYDIDNPILNIRILMIEPIEPMNYLPVCLNVLHICSDWCGDCDDFYLISFCSQVLHSYKELRVYENYHYQMIEHLLLLAQSEHLKRYKKKPKSFFSLFCWFL